MLHQLEDFELKILLWHLKRRPAQTPPDPLPYIWFLRGGRGSGKTWTASNHIFELTATMPFTPENRTIRVALIGETFDDVKGTMIEGRSGLLSVVPEDMVLAWNRSLGELIVELPQSAAVPERREIRFTTYTSERPDKLRGPEFHCAWIDEPAKFKDADEDPLKAGTTFSNLVMTLRAGTAPHLVVTGTPTACPLVRYFNSHPDAVVTHMTSLENWENLPANFQAEISRLAPTSRTARQEIYAEILDDNPDALFFQSVIDETRWIGEPPYDDLTFSEVIGWDPSVSSGEDADEAGIMLAGWTAEYRPDGRQVGEGYRPPQAYLLEDLSGHYTPTEQTRIVIKTLLERRVGDLVFESNQGADFVLTQIHNELATQTIEPPIRRDLRSKSARYGAIKRYRFKVVLESGEPWSFTVSAIHAQHGKQLRAEVAAMKYDHGQVHHPPDGLVELEKEMTSWNPLGKKSPNRVDAAVYALLHIFGDKSLRGGGRARISAPTPAPLRPLPTGSMLRKSGTASIWSMDVMERKGPG
jgi:phage terminase large subunit-like protein